MNFRPAGFSDSSEDDDGGWMTEVTDQPKNRRMGAGGGGGGNIDWGSVSASNNNIDVKFEDEAQQKLLERTKKYLRSILLSTKGLTEIHDVEKEYHESTESRIPFRELGFSGLEEFLKSIPSVCRVRNMGFSVMVEGVADSDTRHIKMMISAQKTQGGKKKKRRGGGGGGRGYSGYSRSSGGFSHGSQYFDYGGFSIGGGKGGYGTSLTSSKNLTTSSKSIQQSRSASSSSKNMPLYKALDSAASKSSLKSNQTNVGKSKCETEDLQKLPQTKNMATVSDRLEELLRGRAFGLLLNQVSKMYEKKWLEGLPDVIEMQKMAKFCIEGKGTAPKIIKLIEDKDEKQSREVNNAVISVPEESGCLVNVGEESDCVVSVGEEEESDCLVNVGEGEPGFSEAEMLIVNHIKKLLESRVFGLPKARVEILVKKECGSNFDCDIFDQMERSKLVTIEGQHKVVKWIAV